MNQAELKVFIEQSWENRDNGIPENFFEHFELFLSSLEDGSIRAAEPTKDGWAVNSWVKQGILLGFKYGKVVPMGTADSFKFFDKDTYPTQYMHGTNRNIRIVPGGSSVRRGAYVGNSVTMMPPMYINTGAYVDEGTMVDSHALVGSCAQIGKRVHLSASAQIGGVLEPIGAVPVVVEDDCMIGGNTGIYEGTRVGKRAVIGAGVILTKSTPVYDLVNKSVIRSTEDKPLIIPEGAVVIPGTRPVTSNAWAHEQGISVQCPIIIKYRDEKTDASTNLEDLLR